MNPAEKKIISKLINLKENYHVSGIKAEFESEGSRFDEVYRLKELLTEANLELTLKVGGCEAISDIQEAKNIGFSTLVAPMIETPYAMKKYVKAIHSVFSDEEIKNKKFLINIETITGYNNLNDIISSKEFDTIDGIVLGRGDMTGSMGLTREEINSNQILNIAACISNKIQTLNKLFFVGGGVSVDSLPFFEQLPYISGFQTRKVIFDSKAIKDIKADEGIIKAIEFEILWLKNKQEYSCFTKEDENRIQMLLKYNKSAKADSIYV